MFYFSINKKKKAILEANKVVFIKDVQAIDIFGQTHVIPMKEIIIKGLINWNEKYKLWLLKTNNCDLDADKLFTEIDLLLEEEGLEEEVSSGDEITIIIKKG